MLTLPSRIITFFNPFAPVFYGETTWEKAKLLIVGTILTSGKRTVASALRVMGLGDDPHYSKYHHVLNRAKWSSLELGHVLLQMLLSTFSLGNEPLVFGIDETIERRWGHKIRARGIYRDAVRSSKSHFVKVSGLRWISLMLLTPISWAQRVWALPVMTVLAPSARFYTDQGRHPKTLLERAQQIIKGLRRWLPEQDIIVVGDQTYATFDFLATCQAETITAIVRLRMDAALYDPAPPYSGRGRPRKKGARQIKLAERLEDDTLLWESVELDWYDGQQRTMEIASGTAVWYHSGKPVIAGRWVLVRDPQGDYPPFALFSTHVDYAPQSIAQWFVQRWCVEVTFEEVRRHLGVETQRQWSDKAIERTTPILLGLFSWVTLIADQLLTQDPDLPTRNSAWYPKTLPTFSDALAWIRIRLWQTPGTFYMSESKTNIVKIPLQYFKSLLDAVCYVA